MASGGYGPVLRQVGRLLGGGGAVGSLEGGRLLERFAADRDGPAFEALVARHGPMVLGTCRRILADPHDVEDAFQATFLVLARRAGSIHDGDRLGPWLHGVARRVAVRSRALGARRRARERPGAEDRAISGPDPDPSEGLELRSAIDEELARLPEKYRAPMVLCYLEGMTHDEAALRLRWPVGTVRSRLAGARDRLRSRLTRRGLAPSAAVPAALSAPALPEALLSATVRLATAPGTVPAHVAGLAKGALVAMIWHKLKAIAAVGLLAGLAVGGVGALAQQGGGGKPVDPPDRPKAVEEPKNFEQRVVEVRDERDRLKEDLQAALRRVEELKFRGQKLDEEWKELVRSGDRPLAKPEAPKALAPESFPVAPVLLPRPEASPTVQSLGNDLVLVMPAGLDRATVLNTRTGDRKTCRLPGTLTEVIPIVGHGLMALRFKGPEIRRLAVYNFESGEWASQDLREPAKFQIDPVVGRSIVMYQAGPAIYCYFGQEAKKKWVILEAKGATSAYASVGGVGLMAPLLEGTEIAQVAVMDTATGECFSQDLREPFSGKLTPIEVGGVAAYQAGRFVYAFSRAARKWGILELKGPARPTVMGQQMLGQQLRGLVIPDGDLIHVFKSDTGEWIHLDTKDDK